MFAKALILALAVAASYCQEHHYALKTIVRHENPKEYIHVPDHAASQEPAPIYELQYQTESQEQAVSSQSQSVHHEPAEHDIQLSNEKHAMPLYHYLQQEEHKPVHFHHGISLQSLYKHDGSAHSAPATHKHQPHHEPSHYESHYSQEDLSHHAPQHHVASHHVSSHHAAHSEESHEKPIDYYAHPKYQYEYKVEDPHTGDNKYQQEVRDGDVVKGVYSFHEADGSIRTVEYTSDKHNGFNAIVKHTPPRQHAQGHEHHHQGHEHHHQN